MCDNLRNTESTTSSRYSLPYYGKKEGIRCPKFEKLKIEWEFENRTKGRCTSVEGTRSLAPVWRGVNDFDVNYLITFN